VVGAGDHAIGVETAEGEVLPAELVGCGGRRQPALDVLEGSGIEVGRGVRVGAALQTSHPDVFAAGDVAEPAGAGAPAACADGSLAGEEACCFCWQRAWAQGGVAAAGMLGNKPKPVRESMRVRTALFGRDLAVMGRAHLPEGGSVKAVELRSDGGRFRRLVYEDDRLVGAAVWGTGEWVHKLNRLVGEGASREAVEAALGLGPEPQAQDVLPRTFAAHCPICAAELVVREGTPLGSRLDCVACSSSLVVCWDGRRGWLEIPGE
jgi:NAD(P)H-nitrite reductase large subunit